MKYIIASDLHGVLEYTKKLDYLIDLEKKELDGVILLGDLLTNYRYYDEEEVNEVIKILNKHAKYIIAVCGNGDTRMDQERLLFDISHEIQKIKIDDKEYYLTHGHLLYKYEHLLDNHSAFVGHTHVYDIDDIHINPGSVGFPRRNLEHTCILYQNHKISLINLDNYDIIMEKIV